MSHIYSPLPQIFHHIRGALQLQIAPQLSTFTMSFLCEEDPPPPRSTLWGSIQVPRLPYDGYPISVVILFGMHIFLYSPSLPGTNFKPWFKLYCNVTEIVITLHKVMEIIMKIIFFLKFYYILCCNVRK